MNLIDTLYILFIYSLALIGVVLFIASLFRKKEAVEVTDADKVVTEMRRQQLTNYYVNPVVNRLKKD